MTDLEKIVYTACLTVIGGIFIAVIGQVFVKFIIEPMQAQSILIGEIANSLVLYSNVGAAVEPYYFKQIKAAEKLEEPEKSIVIKRYEEILQNGWKKSDDAAEVLRLQASKLMGQTYAIPQYWLLAPIFRKPSPEDVLKASTELIGMANSTHKGDSQDDRIRKIAKLLKIRILIERFGEPKD